MSASDEPQCRYCTGAHRGGDCPNVGIDARVAANHEEGRICLCKREYVLTPHDRSCSFYAASDEPRETCGHVVGDDLAREIRRQWPDLGRVLDSVNTENAPVIAAVLAEVAKGITNIEVVGRSFAEQHIALAAVHICEAIRIKAGGAT
jgi:hypothetical protein